MKSCLIYEFRGSSSFKQNFESSTIDKLYNVLQQIQKNHEQTIYQGIDKKNKKFIFIKVMDFTQLEDKVGFQKKQLIKRKNKKEIQLLEKCQCIYIPKQFTLCENSKYKIIISQCNSRKSLEEHAFERNYNELESIIILKQIICALHELNKYTYAHTSLEPKNIVFSYGIYKIVEFGYNKLIEESKKDFSEELGSPNQFIAPQIHKDQSHDLRAQVWNVAVIFYFLIFKKLPFFHYLQNSNEKIQLQRNGISKIAQNFLEKALQLNPNNRMNWNQMIAHPLFDKGGLELPRYFLVNPEIKCFSYSKQYESQHRNTSVQKKLFISEIAKPYFNEKFKLDIDKIEENENIQNLFANLISEQYKFQDYNKMFLRLKKALFTLKNLYWPILNKYLIKQKRLRTQFLYLLLKMSLFSLQKLRKQIKIKKKQSQSDQDKIKLNSLFIFLHQLENSISTNLQYLNPQIKQEWKKWKNQIYDFFVKKKITSFYREKLKYLFGINDIDFTQEQLCNYINQYFERQLKNKMHKSAQSKKQRKQLYEYLVNYLLINSYIPQQLLWNQNNTFQAFCSSFKHQ